MSKFSITRRGWISAAVGLPLATAAAAQAERDDPSEPPKNTVEALARLKEGNLRFVSGRVRHAHQAAAWREHLKESQEPFATILACSDSRVPPELVFDQGFGDLFVIRAAGNVVALDVIGSLQYAIRHLHTSLIVVMGHESCGAVTAAVEVLRGRGDEPRYIAALVNAIEPGFKGLPAELKGADRVRMAVEANVRWSMRQLAELPEGKLALEQKRITLVGAVYELDTGTVRFLV